MTTISLSHPSEFDELTNMDGIVYFSNYPQQPKAMWGYDDNINLLRNEIDGVHPDVWKKIRWHINEYDFVVKDPIINRAFFKYWEIVNEFDIFQNFVKETDIILHCAEAPGGFIQASNIFLQLDNNTSTKQKKEKITIDDDGFTTIRKNINRQKEYKIFTISLNKDLPCYKNYNLPSYNKSIMHKQLCITYGKDNTGDINNWENILYIKKKARKNMFLVTADGGFDEGTDFNNKEQLHYQLILSEIYTAMKLQAKHGHFILKMFDIFTETSVHFLYLLSQCYSEVYIYKPKTSRPTNSEKYVVCKNFLLEQETSTLVCNELENIKAKIDKSKSKYIDIRLFNDIPISFQQKVAKMNNIILTNQCNFLKSALVLCKDVEFLNNYENIIEKTFERRKAVFADWSATFNLSSYV